MRNDEAVELRLSGAEAMASTQIKRVCVKRFDDFLEHGVNDFVDRARGGVGHEL